MTSVWMVGAGSMLARLSSRPINAGRPAMRAAFFYSSGMMR